MPMSNAWKSLLKLQSRLNHPKIHTRPISGDYNHSRQIPSPLPLHLPYLRRPISSNSRCLPAIANRSLDSTSPRGTQCLLMLCFCVRRFDRLSSYVKMGGARFVSKEIVVHFRFYPFQVKRIVVRRDDRPNSLKHDFDLMGRVLQAT